jgi:hypothetical protein
LIESACSEALNTAPFHLRLAVRPERRLDRPEQPVQNARSRSRPSPISARPDDWFLFARRAWARSDKDYKAGTQFREAERLGSRDQVLDFQAQHVHVCTKAGRWADTLRNLDGLIAARPDDIAILEDRASPDGKLGRETDRRTDLDRVFELGADEGFVIPRRDAAKPAEGTRTRLFSHAVAGEGRSANNSCRAGASPA